MNIDQATQQGYPSLVDRNARHGYYQICIQTDLFFLCHVHSSLSLNESLHISAMETIEGLVALRRTKPCMSIEVFLLSCAPYCTVNNSLSYSMHDRSVASGLQCLHIEADLGILITSSLLSISFLHYYYLCAFSRTRSSRNLLLALSLLAKGVHKSSEYLDRLL